MRGLPMIVIVPMAGEGSRFKEKGYTTPKPLIPTYSIRLNKTVPMVIAAVSDIPSVDENSKIIFIGRIFHKESDIENIFKKYFKNSTFLYLDSLSDGQASTCALGVNQVQQNEEIFICSCDTGMDLNNEEFQEVKKKSDTISFTHKNHYFVEENPSAYGWLQSDSDGNVTDVSVKKQVSNLPLKDHAIVGNFWFRSPEVFIKCYESLHLENDRINGEFYVDQMLKHSLRLGFRTKVFQIQKCLCWGTPAEYDNYNKTLEYWNKFLKREKDWIA